MKVSSCLLTSDGQKSRRTASCQPHSRSVITSALSDGRFQDEGRVQDKEKADIFSCCAERLQIWPKSDGQERFFFSGKNSGSGKINK